VILSVNVPRAVDPVVRTVSVDAPGAVTGFGLRLDVAPVGRPETDRETLPVNPPSRATLIV
jgi:hypothetical protein